MDEHVFFPSISCSKNSCVCFVPKDGYLTNVSVLVRGCFTNYSNDNVTFVGGFDSRLHVLSCFTQALMQAVTCCEYSMKVVR